MRRLVLLGAVVLATLALWQSAVHPASAQRGRDPRQRGGRGGGGRPAPPSALLELVTDLKCVFPASAVATWEGGEPQARVTNTSAGFTLTITNIDAQEGTAQIPGPGAPRDVSVKLAGSNLHLLDTRPDGSLGITTVFSQESHDGRLKAVHSRVPDVSQYYGDCEIETRPVLTRPAR